MKELMIGLYQTCECAHCTQRKSDQIVQVWLNSGPEYAEPNYPVPSTLGVVDLNAYPGIVCINDPTGNDWVIAWDFWGRWNREPLVLGPGAKAH